MADRRRAVARQARGGAAQRAGPEGPGRRAAPPTLPSTDGALGALRGVRAAPRHPRAEIWLVAEPRKLWRRHPRVSPRRLDVRAPARVFERVGQAHRPAVVLKAQSARASCDRGSIPSLGRVKSCSTAVECSVLVWYLIFCSVPGGGRVSCRVCQHDHVCHVCSHAHGHVNSFLSCSHTPHL